LSQSFYERARPAIYIAIGISVVVTVSVLTAQMNRFPTSTGGQEFGLPGLLNGNNIFANIDQGPFGTDQKMKKFSSYDEMAGFLKDVQAYFSKLYATPSYPSYGGGGLYGGGTAQEFAPSFSFGGALSGMYNAPMTQDSSIRMAESSQSNSEQPSFEEGGGNPDGIDFSGTNIQVPGVDEADFLKVDGKYTYMISGDRLTIIDAYPPESAKIVSKVQLDIPEGQSLQNMFLNGDSLVVFYQEYGQHTIIPEYGYAPEPIYAPSTHALIIDVSDRADPKVIRNYEVSGEYSNSRMIGSRVFLLTFSGVDYQRPVAPTVAESSKTVMTPEVYYFDNPEQSYTFNTVTAINLDGIKAREPAGALLSKTFMIGSASAVYASENNIYIAYQENVPFEYYQKSSKDKFSTVIVPLLPNDVQKQIKSIEEDDSLSSSQKWESVSSLLQKTYDGMSDSEKSRLFSKMQNGIAEYDSIIARDSQKTIVHKISISGDNLLQYVAKGEVPGRLLNQFSMDEHDGKFRVATTSEYSTPRKFEMHNNVYTLGKDMEIVGRLEGIAPDESIYSARFMGDRLYLVTFQRTDPFFVIDLSGDEPKVLGKLKLPGFSNYLHPYDRDHIIGIGRETEENQYGSVAFLGVKLALFDVSDVNDPKAVDTFMIGGSQTDSEALRDHKALLFDKEKNVLSLPIFSPDLDARMTDGGAYKEPGLWNGFYVFSLSDNKEFQLKGTIEHETDSNYYGSQGSRSFYIGDTLYTVTPTMMKMSDLDNPDNEINKLALSGTGNLIKPLPVQ
jgi:uncharacterized secreted protein with C-terminal beta-propeller domain